MADQKLSELTTATTIGSTDLVYAVIGGNSRKITRDNFTTSLALGTLTSNIGTSGTIASTSTVTGTKLVPTGNVTAGNGMYLPATNAVAFSTNGSERMRILSDGKVGIGTNAPAVTFVVEAPNPDLATTNTVASFLGGSPSSGSNTKVDFLSRRETGGGDRWFAFQVSDLGSTTRPLRLQPSGSGVVIGSTYTGVPALTGLLVDSRVGIGTGTPNELLEVNGNIHVSGGDRTIFNRSNNSLQLGSNNTGRLTVKAAGQTRFVPLAADPSGPENGDVYYNSATDKLRLYAAGSWVDLN